MARRRAMDRAMHMFADTFRALSVVRDSLMFRVEEPHTDTTPLQSELKRLGWGKAEKMKVLFTDQLEAISRANIESGAGEGVKEEYYQVQCHEYPSQRIR